MIKLIDRWLEKKVRVLESIDPNHFTAKELTKFYNFIPLPLMKYLCAMAVKQRLYNQHLEKSGEIYFSLNKEK